ncbi:lantibiotic dehydratase [Streptomyces sp. P6-2-1]|uniref:lantibiotic dehydratase n=1 Tax=Streptomyces sp. P6-2-1 TaxID=3422591 RepID=UPI003D359DAF
MRRAPALFTAGAHFLYRAPLTLPTSDACALPLPPAGPQDLSACAGLLAAVPACAALSEALELATPSLTALVRRVVAQGAEGVRPGQLRRAALAVLRYDIRMRSRPTPFGLFAGVTTGDFGADTLVRRGPAHRTRTHADMQWLTRIVHRLEEDPAVLRTLPLQAHQALTLRGDRIVLTASSARGARLVEGEETRATVSVRHTPVVSRALAESAGPLPYGELARRLTRAFPTAPATRVHDLLAQLVRQEILLTGLRPPLDGGDPLGHVLGLLARVTEPSPRSRRLHDGLRAVDRERRAYDAAAYATGQERLRALLATARATEPDETPLHIDTRIDAAVRLPRAVAEEVERATEAMWRLSRPKLGLSALRGYHQRFLDVYGADRLVPLLDLLDESTGLGAPAGYGWPNGDLPPAPPPEPPRTARRDRAMARIVAAAQRSRCREFVLDDADLADLCHDLAEPAELPTSAEVTVHVVAPSAEALDKGEFRVFLSPSPGSHRAGATFARFADLPPGHPPQAADSGEQQPAECVPVPAVHIEGAVPVDLAFRTRSGRAANLAHTVPATGRRISVGVPEAPGVEELRLADIGIGATLDRLTAVHLPTGRELVPVLGNMVSAAAQAPNAVRLLWEIGLEGQRLWEPWNWGALADAPFVPRVRYGRFVLAPAVWRLDTLRAAATVRTEDRAENVRTRPGSPLPAQPGPADLEPAPPGTPETALSPEQVWDLEVARWRESWDVPRQVLVVTTDQRLLLDLEEPWHRALLRDEVRRHSELVAQEVPGEYESWLASPLAGHTAELVVPLTRRSAAAPLRKPYQGHHQPTRTVHGLGGEWLYLKLRGAARAQDDLLRTHVPALVRCAAEHGADGWFFLRYTDEAGHHLRLRLHGPPGELWGAVAAPLGRLLEDWRARGLVRGHSLAAYDPETERYGGAAAQRLAERVFQYDSEAAVALLHLAKDPANDYGVDDLAALSCSALAHAFGRPSPHHPARAGEFGEEAASAWLSLTGTRRELPSAYRRRAAHWRRLIDPADDGPPPPGDPARAAALAALAPRDAAVRELAAHVRAVGETPEGRVVGSLLHMTCNRLFGGQSARELTVLGIARGATQDNCRARRHREERRQTAAGREATEAPGSAGSAGTEPGTANAWAKGAKDESPGPPVRAGRVSADRGRGPVRSDSGSPASARSASADPVPAGPVPASPVSTSPGSAIPVAVRPESAGHTRPTPDAPRSPSSRRSP